ncbi:MAG TPA: hypothetical protein VGP46_07155, partial [Acidimicrobiales bacterium]|nr:hypothetical protein [Acidimicrobiales bacterium]
MTDNNSQSRNSFGSAATLQVGEDSYSIHRLDSLSALADLSRIPFSLKLLLENLLRHEDGRHVVADDISALASAAATGAVSEREIAFSPARILLQDFTGVPCVVDLAAMRDAVEVLCGKPDV